ncbi:MAG TPA: radical SAM protein [Candidatus Paceibacterota bacterium]|nr:radical SAM protein [Candidatus Paceibacterota bacterium]HPT40491.1 radical SAM protein [Candidatus Paceibacterota bacterium]
MKYRNLCGPISVQIEITEACNLNCVHCYNHWRDKTKPFHANNLDDVKMNKIIDYLIDTKASSVTLTGGEPLLFWNILPGAIERMISAGIRVGLNSNLSLLTEEVARALKQSGLKNILVSVLCGVQEIHDLITGCDGSWQKTIDGIKMARKFGFRVSSNTVLTKLNLKYLYETAELMKRLGVSTFCATKASPALNSRNFQDLVLSRYELQNSLNELLRIKEELKMNVDILECYPLCLIGDLSKYSHFARHKCTAGVTTCTISPSGDMRPCSHANMIYGNVFKENMIDIWMKMVDWRGAQYVPDECQSCEFVGRCSGGCRMEASYHGDIKGKDPFMSGPEDVKIQPTVDKNDKSILTMKLKVSPQLKIRDESFGATVTVPSGTLFLNKDAVFILRYLLTCDIFTVNLVAEKYDLKVDVVNQLLQSLLKSGMVQEVR